MPPRLAPGTTLYVIRHGETDWNRDARYQGQQDIPLNDVGRAQARANGERLARSIGPVADIDFVASPMIRAVETMQLVRRALKLLPNSFRTDPLLREVNYGHWEGQLAADLPATDPAGIAARERDPFGSRPLGGETYAELMARTDQWLETVSSDTVVVTHGGVMRTLRGRVYDLDRSVIPRLEVPQDRILVLRADAMVWL